MEHGQVLMGRGSALSRKLRSARPVMGDSRAQLLVMSRPWERRVRKSRRPRAKGGPIICSLLTHHIPLTYAHVCTHAHTLMKGHT